MESEERSTFYAHARLRRSDILPDFQPGQSLLCCDLAPGGDIDPPPGGKPVPATFNHWYRAYPGWASVTLHLPTGDLDIFCERRFLRPVEPTAAWHDESGGGGQRFNARMKALGLTAEFVLAYLEDGRALDKLSDTVFTEEEAFARLEALAEGQGR